MRRWLYALSLLALAGIACGGAAGRSRPLSSTPAPDRGPSDVDAATLTAITILVLATPTAAPATATSRPPTAAPPAPTATRAPTQPPPPPATLPPLMTLLDVTCTTTSIGQTKIEGKVRNNTPDR